MSRVFLGLGSNLGDRHSRLQAAIARLRKIASVTAVSRVYETAPVGGPTQGLFLNAAACIDWPSQDLLALLDLTQAIERDEGRVHVTPWGPRTLDVDLLYADDVDVATDVLVVPHARLFERAFALVPLLDIADGDLERRSRVALATLRGHLVKLTDHTLA